jgi:hypothetical protein
MKTTISFIIFVAIGLMVYSQNGNIPASKVPTVVKTTLLSKCPNAHCIKWEGSKVSWNRDSVHADSAKTILYTATFRDKNIRTEMDIWEDGMFSYSEATLKKLPANVLSTLVKSNDPFAYRKIDEIYKDIDSKGRVTYSFSVKAAYIDYTFDESGKLTEKKIAAPGIKKPIIVVE